MSNQADKTPGCGAAPGAAGIHPSDESLAALLEDGADQSATRRHVADCPVCTQRLVELRTLRRVLQQSAAREATPPRDLAGAALRRLRQRQGTVGRFNELVTILVGFVRGVATLLADPGPGQNATRNGHNGRGPVTPRPAADATGVTGAAGAAGTGGGSRG